MRNTLFLNLVLMVTVTAAVASPSSTIDPKIPPKAESSLEKPITLERKDNFLSPEKTSDISKICSYSPTKDIHKEEERPSAKQLTKTAVDTLMPTPKMERERAQAGAYRGPNPLPLPQPLPHQTGTK